MAINAYEKNGIKVYRVHVKVRNKGVQVNRIRIGVPSLTRARRIEFELKTQLLKLKDSTSSYTWDQWVETCLEKMKLEFKNSTIINYQAGFNKWITPLFADKFLHEIKKSHVHEIIFQERQASGETRRTILKRMKRIFNMAIEEGALPFNPALGIKVSVEQKRKLCLNTEEIKVFLNKAYYLKHPYYEIWSMALMTGMRSGELQALLWTDVDFANQYISVNKSWSSRNGVGPTKSSHTRSVPISKTLAKLLKELKLKNTNSFVLPRLESWKKGYQAQITRELCVEHNLTPIGFHDLRATFITQMLIKDVPLAKVMTIVGHANIKTTMVYLRMIAKDVEGATEALGIELPDAIDDTKKLVSLFQQEC